MQTSAKPVMVEDPEGREKASKAEVDREDIDEADWDHLGPDPSLEDVFEGLNLHGEEEEDLDLSGEVEDLIKDVRWLALFRVHTLRPFSHAAVLNSMRNAWSCAQGVTFNIKGPNLFLVQCHCLGDWKRVMEGGPWQFRRDPVVIVEYDGFTNVSDYSLNMYPLWARVKGLPDGLTRRKELAEKVAKKVGDPPFTVVVNERKINPSSYLRVRVYVNVNIPLVRFVPITLKERKKYPVFYEKLPDFCFFCGCMGHVVEECGDGIHDPSSCEWGEWLHWSSESASSGARGGWGSWSETGRGGGATGEGSRGGSRGGGGRGDRGGRVYSSGGRSGGAGIPEDMDVQQQAYVGTDEDGRTVRKRLIREDDSVNIRGQAVPYLTGKVAGTVLLLEQGSAVNVLGEIGQPSGTPGKDPKVKRR